VGVARARDIANRRNLSDDTVRRMVSYFARHEIDKQGQGWSPDEDGYPSAGRIAWALWGGDPGRAWADAEVRSMADNESRAREQLSVNFALTECHSADSPADDGIVCRFAGIASIFGQQFDAYIPQRGRVEATVIHPGAFAKTIQERDPGKVKILWQHRDDLPPIGAAVQLAESRDGLLIAGKIVGTSLGEDVAKLMRAGVLNELSIGATAIKYDFEDESDTTVRNVREWMLHEVSVVDEGANPGSRVTDLMRRYDDVFWGDLAARCRDASDEEVLRIVSAPFEGHAGKVLSDRNRTLVKQAIDALQALIAAAEPQAAPSPALTVHRSELLTAALRLAELEQRIKTQERQWTI
jgi:HK97 family phage prohead protease